MRLGFGFVCLLVLAGSAAARADDSGTCAAPFSVPAEAGMRLQIGTRSAEIEVQGTDGQQLRISCTLDDTARAGEVRFRFHRTGVFGELAISGGPQGNVHLRIEVPHQTHLKLRIPAGEVRINNLAGDKDIDAKAGEIVVTGVNPQQYRFVRASVQIGEVRAPAFGADKGGFFRTLERSSRDGLYRLDAHVITGSIQLN